MSNEAALAFVKNAQLAARSANLSEYRAAAEELGGHLLTVAPFSSVREAMILSDRGSWSFNMVTLGIWVLDRLEAGDQLEDILALAQSTIARNSVAKRDFRVINGVALDERLDFAPGIYILPHNLVPSSRSKGSAFVSPFMPDVAGEQPALVQEFKQNPLFSFKGDLSEHVKAAMLQIDQRDRVASEVRAAMTLASKGAIEFGAYYSTADETEFPSCFSPVSSSMTTPVVLQSHSLDLKQASEAYSLLTVFTHREPLILALERVLKARSNWQRIDKVIDYGIALEILLMHSTSRRGDRKGEITNRISQRGAWLLGADVQAREKVARAVKQLYAARSNAVHLGELPKAEQFIDTGPFDSLICEVCWKLLQRGEFPSWDRLVLGAQD